jgi:hypothetical protein
VPFRAWHLEWLTLQESQMALSRNLTMVYGQTLEQAGPAYSAFVGATVIACAGVVEFWKGRAQVWSLLSDQLPQYKKSVHKGVKTFLDQYRIRRLECVVDPRCEPAKRWAERLGFYLESSMPNYTPNGDRQLMFVRLE